MLTYQHEARDAYDNFRNFIMNTHSYKFWFRKREAGEITDGQLAEKLHEIWVGNLCSMHISTPERQRQAELVTWYEKNQA